MSLLHSNIWLAKDKVIIKLLDADKKLTEQMQSLIIMKNQQQKGSDDNLSKVLPVGGTRTAFGRGPTTMPCSHYASQQAGT